MQYLVSVPHESEELATPAEMEAIDAFNDRLGQLINAAYLRAQYTRNRLVAGRRSVRPTAPLDDSPTCEARAAYDKAIDLAGNTGEIFHLSRRRDQLM